MPPAPCPDMCSEHHKRAWTSDHDYEADGYSDHNWEADGDSPW
ncbi:MAG: hypothetical protein Q4C09_01030 [Atopobiaceae bacterium]|nr:hypothetical protein [Atopobiaceae bacterium]